MAHPPAASPHRLDAEHPDKDGLQLRAISHVLKIFDKEAKAVYGAGCKVGVFFDYVSMPQRSRGSAEDDRTPEELAIFGRALKVPHTPLAATLNTLPHRPPPTPRRLPPYHRESICGTGTRRRTSCWSTRSCPRARTPTRSRTRGAAGA